MNIDSHQHFWIYHPQRDSWITEEMSVLMRDFLPDELIAELRSNGMDGCIAVQADQSEQETDFLLELAARYDHIKGVIGWADLCSANLPARLEHFSQFKKLRGFRHLVQSEPDDRFLLREDFCRGIEQLAAYNLTYDILVYPRQLPAAIELVERFPAQKFVLDHMAKPPIRSGELDPWAHNIRAIAGFPNIHCKLSGLITEANWASWRQEDFIPYLDVVFEAFTPDRLMFGSDWPVCLLAGSYRSVRQLITDYVRVLPVATQQGIFGANAWNFYGLGTS
jgi:L-fucono-1,5-lactonase